MHRRQIAGQGGDGILRLGKTLPCDRSIFAGCIYIPYFRLEKRGVIGNEAPDIDISHGGVTEDEGRSSRTIGESIILACSLFARIERQFAHFVCTTGNLCTFGTQTRLIEVKHFVTGFGVIVIDIVVLRQAHRGIPA